MSPIVHASWTSHLSNDRVLDVQGVWLDGVGDLGDFGKGVVSSRYSWVLHTFVAMVSHLLNAIKLFLSNCLFSGNVGGFKGVLLGILCQNFELSKFVATVIDLFSSLEQNRAYNL